MKAPKETTDKAQIGEVKETYSPCIDWITIDFSKPIVITPLTDIDAERYKIKWVFE